MPVAFLYRQIFVSRLGPVGFEPVMNAYHCWRRRAELLPRSKVATHFTVLQGMSKETRPRYQPRLNILICFALLRPVRTVKPRKLSPNPSLFRNSPFFSLPPQIG